MPNTPFFAAWRPRLAALGGRTAQTLQRVRSYTLCQLENSFSSSLPHDLFPKAAQGPNSRDAVYTRSRTFWCMLWQALNPKAAGREVVRQIQALFTLEGGPRISEEDGAYCRAKARLPLSEFPRALAASAKVAGQKAPALALLQGRPLKAADGSTLTLADTDKNRQAYPALQCTNIPSFPMMHLVVLFCLASGAVLALAQGSWNDSELSLLGSLSSHLARGDILLGDRGFGCYPLVAFLAHTLGIDFIGRTRRRVDGRRRIGRLAKNDWLMVWEKGPQPSAWLTAVQWAGLPCHITLRAVRGRCSQKGFRVRHVTVVTTLLDPQLYPAQEILRAYLLRWRLEMCLDDLKTTLEMETLRGQSPEMAQKEVYARLIVHNLIRCILTQAALQHHVALERISFKGSLDALRQFSQAMSQARTKKKRQQIWEQLLQTLAADLVPHRPGRREPRAVKRKKNKYPRLDAPRHQFRDHPKRGVRRKIARLRRLGLM
ncbi:MAG: IS4 family transposase [Verrucomicrobiota bacterium]|jgi:hypothetical protein